MCIIYFSIISTKLSLSASIKYDKNKMNSHHYIRCRSRTILRPEKKNSKKEYNLKRPHHENQPHFAVCRRQPIFDDAYTKSVVNPPFSENPHSLVSDIPTTSFYFLYVGFFVGHIKNSLNRESRRDLSSYIPCCVRICHLYAINIGPH